MTTKFIVSVILAILAYLLARLVLNEVWSLLIAIVTFIVLLTSGGDRLRY